MNLSLRDFEALRTYIHNASGIALNKEKLYLVKQRLEPLVKSTGCENFSKFTEKLLKNDSIQLRNEVILSITTNETSFFRDVHPFEAFEHYILPKLGNLIQDRKSINPESGVGSKVYILSIGASTGQEPYSLAMLIHEFAEHKPHLNVCGEDFSILGIDISKRALEKAISGTYAGMDIERGLTIERISKYFKQVDGQWKLDNSIRNIVRFLHLNITEASSLSGLVFDVIFCRNIMIYFDDETKTRLLDKIYRILADQGFLILGAMENIYGLTDKFEPIPGGSTILYRKKKI
jgi:chemotaxis protein methyltransferase CheR